MASTVGPSSFEQRKQMCRKSLGTVLRVFCLLLLRGQLPPLESGPPLLTCGLIFFPGVRWESEVGWGQLL